MSLTKRDPLDPRWCRARRAGCAGCAPAAGQRGIVLFVALILLVVLTLLGVAMARLQSTEELVAQNNQNHQMAIQGAEATLRYAEAGLQFGNYGTAGCVQNTAGQYQWFIGTTDAYTLYGPGSTTGTLQYGGASLPVAAPPRFVIECMPDATLPGESGSITGYGARSPQVNIYRITAYSYGGDANATAELQSIYRQ